MGVGRKALRIGKLGSVYTIGGILPQMLGILLVPVFTRLLDPSQMGVLTLGQKVMGTLAVIVQMGLWTGLKSHYFRTPEPDRPRLVRTVQLAVIFQSAVLCAILSLAGPWVAGVLLPNLPLSGDLLLVLWLLVVWGCFLQAMTRMGRGMLQLQERAFPSVGIGLLQFVVGTLCALAAVVALWRWGLGNEGLGRFAGVWIGALAAGVAAFVVVWRVGRGRFDFSMYRRVLPTGLSFVPHALVSSLVLTANLWLLSTMLGPGKGSESVGIYIQAVRFPAMMEMPLFALGTAFFPTLSKLMADGSAEARREHSRLVTLIMAFILWIMLCISCFAPVAVKVLVAPQYHAALGVVPILVLAYLLRGLSIAPGQPLFFTGSGFLAALGSGANVLVSIVLCLVLIPRYEMYGAGWAMAGGFGAQLCVYCVVSHHKFPIPWQYSVLLRAVAGVVGLGLAEMWVSAQLPLGWAIGVKVLFVLAAIPVMVLAGVVSPRELTWAWGLVVAKFRRDG